MVATRAEYDSVALQAESAASVDAPEGPPTAPDSSRPPPPLGEPRVIAPAVKRLRVRELWETLPVVRVLAVRDFKARYKQSALGPLWILIQPLGILAAFTVVFDGVAEVDTHGIPYPLFALVGITVWSFAQLSLTWGSRCQVMNRMLIKRVNAPRLAFVSASMIASLPQLALMLVLTVASVLILGRDVTWRFLLLPVCLLWLFCFCWILVQMFSAMNVRYRDVSSMVPFLMQGSLLLTPVAYPTSEAPDTLQTLINLNPLTGLIEAFRWSLLGSAVDGQAIVIALGWTALLALVAWQVFARLEVRFADVI
jgi:ABC-type polysaccharide/polyol phosphate export permease